MTFYQRKPGEWFEPTVRLVSGSFTYPLGLSSSLENGESYVKTNITHRAMASR